MNRKSIFVVFSILALLAVSFSAPASDCDQTLKETNTITLENSIDLIKSNLPSEVSSVMSWDNEKNILTMTDADLYFSKDITFGLNLPDKTTMVLSGNNKVSGKFVAAVACGSENGEMGTGSLVIEGGCLTIDATALHGIVASHLSVKNCILDVSESLNVGIDCNPNFGDKTLELHDSTLKIEANIGLYYFSYVFDNSKVEITATTSAFNTNTQPSFEFKNCHDMKGITVSGEEPFDISNLESYIGFACEAGNPTPGDSDSAMKIALIICALVFIGCAGYVLYGKK